MVHKDFEKGLDIRTLLAYQRAFKTLTSVLLSKSARKLIWFQRKQNVAKTTWSTTGLKEESSSSENGDYATIYMKDDLLQKELIRLAVEEKS